MQQVDFSQKVILSEDVLIQTLSEEAVLLNIASEEYFGLDEIGTSMITALTEAESIEGAFQQLLEEYEVEAEILQKDLLQFIETLKEHGLVQVTG